jgi:hypothetical protein
MLPCSTSHARNFLRALRSSNHGAAVSAEQAQPEAEEIAGITAFAAWRISH